MFLFIIKTIVYISNTINSNTSHVFIYRWLCLIQMLCLIHSNTSHVFIYRKRLNLLGNFFIIQIHLMFLFIQHFYNNLFFYCIAFFLYFQHFQHFLPSKKHFSLFYLLLAQSLISAAFFRIYFFYRLVIFTI